MDGAGLLTGLLAADQHRGGLRCRRVFDVAGPTLAALAEEVADIGRSQPPSRPTDAGHVTRWVGPTGDVRVWSLLNRSGRTDDYSADHDRSSRGKWFSHADRAPTLAALLAELPDLVNCRVNLLGPGAELPPHEEHLVFRTAEGAIGARIRLHVPLRTGPTAELALDGDVVHLPAGGVYLVNQGCVHQARNPGPDERVHLVLDARATDRVLALLTGASPPPAGLLRPSGPEVPVRRVEPVPAHRRLPPSVTPAEAAALAPCPPG